jgi:hypothetical protein
MSARAEGIERRRAGYRRRAAAALALAAAGVAGCSTATQRPDGSDSRGSDVVYVDPRTAVCAEAGSSPSYDSMQRIFDSECTTCHIGGADVSLLPGVSWANLVGRPAPATEACGGVLVVPGDPGASYLYQKLTSATPCSGTRMPAGEFGPVPLPDCVIAIVRDWIAEGAPGPSGDAGAD